MNEHMNTLAAAFDGAAKRSPSDEDTASKLNSLTPAQRRAMWNIGLDFGTAFTKCIVRNLAAKEAFVVPLLEKQYMLPSEVMVSGSDLGLVGESKSDPQPVKVHNLKMALAEIAMGHADGAWANNFRQATAHLPANSPARNSGDLVAYFLSRVIQRAKAFIASKSPGFDESRGDHCFLNMAVPVAHAQETKVAAAFEASLRKAWLLARHKDLQEWQQSQLGEALARLQLQPEQDIGCYIYPEVSANVQSYIKSRAGSDGLYLFVDVGAGTVDLSHSHPMTG
jgi:hypothetical protein